MMMTQFPESLINGPMQSQKPPLLVRSPAQMNELVGCKSSWSTKPCQKMRLLPVTLKRSKDYAEFAWGNQYIALHSLH